MSDRASIARHFNGTATVTPDPVDMGTGVVSVFIDNLDLTNDLLVSFDGGSNFKTVGEGRSLSIDISVSTVTVKSSAGSVNYEILATVL